MIADPNNADESSSRPTKQWFVIRHGRQSDYPFVLDSATASIAQSSLGVIHGPRYMSEQKLILNQILKWPTTQLSVAVDAEDDDAIHGYMIFDDWQKPRIYYIYVKAPARKLGIAKSLVGKLYNKAVVYTNRPTKSLVEAGIMKRVPRLWTFSYLQNFYEQTL